jgi:carbonic anhydrase
LLCIANVAENEKELRMASKVLDEVMSANAKYVASFGSKGDLALPPARRFAILTCMDARLDPAKYAGLSEGDAHVIRNAGGRASDDAIRSLIISHKLLGTREWFVIHHTNCGMELFSDEVMANLLEKSLSTASFDGKNWSNPQGELHSRGGSAGHFIKWHTIHSQEESVAQDVRRIREHPLVPAYIPIYGYIYDVKSGRLDEVPKATEAGRAA